MSEAYLYEIYDGREAFEDKDSLYGGGGVAVELAHAQQHLRHGLRPYQAEALQRFFHYEKHYKHKGENNHVLFEMATGTGKTLLMAAVLPYFFTRGYRTFVFFVNSTTIVEKTKQNFIDKGTSKYVFAESLIIDGQRVEVQAIDSIVQAHEACINIVFTTIQGLHSNMQMIRENAVTLEDFQEHKVVLLADEAHHNNTGTKKGLELVHSWEDTVQRIYEQHAENYLLEFTATADLENPAVKAKYKDKALVRYGLKDFRKHGFSKHVHLAQTKTESLEDRFLLAIIMSQYRLEVAAEYGLDIKPVVLFKSRTIAESEEATRRFHALIERMDERHIKAVLQLVQKYHAIPLYRDMYAFFTGRDFSHEWLAKRLCAHFSVDRILNVNTDRQLGCMQGALHTLEEASNQYRAIFAVDKLNEGWDVLNLYDIVKLYETPSTKGKPPTAREIQLIGRGARLFPFAVEKHQERFMRKYDNDSGHPLGVLEQLHFHTSDGSAFIQQLNDDLETEGLIDREMKACEIRLKKGFKESSMYQQGFMYTNERQLRKRANLFQYDLFGAIDTTSLDGIKGAYTIDVSLDIFDMDEKRVILDSDYTKSLTLTLGDVPDTVFVKAVSRDRRYYFESIATMLEIESVLDIKKRCSKNELVITYPKQYTKAQVQTPRALRKVCECFLHNFADYICDEWSVYEGSQTLVSKPIKDVFTDKKVLMNRGDEMFVCERIPYFAQEQVKVNKTEKQCIQDLQGALEDLNMPIQWIIRNERHFALYDFKDGKGFEPDFLLMLKSQEETVYQVFVEVKGEHLHLFDAWKETLIKEIVELEVDTMRYKIVPLPFYTEKEKHTFLDALKHRV